MKTSKMLVSFFTSYLRGRDGLCWQDRGCHAAGGGGQGPGTAGLLFRGPFCLPELLRSPLVAVPLHNKKGEWRRELLPCFTHQGSTVFVLLTPLLKAGRVAGSEQVAQDQVLKKPQGMETAKPLGAARPRSGSAGQGQRRCHQHRFFRRRGEQTERNKCHFLVTVRVGNVKTKHGINPWDGRTVGAFKRTVFSPEVWNGFRQNLHT